MKVSFARFVEGELRCLAYDTSTVVVARERRLSKVAPWFSDFPYHYSTKDDFITNIYDHNIESSLFTHITFQSIMSGRILSTVLSSTLCTKIL